MAIIKIIDDLFMFIEKKGVSRGFSDRLSGGMPTSQIA